MRSPFFLLVLLMSWPWVGVSQQSGSGTLAVYADSLQGRATASGEPYDRGQLTAAHADLPFGTVVRVANFQSGKMVDVRINDRKPRDTRLLVLSGSAAEAIRLPAQQAVTGAFLVMATGGAPSDPGGTSTATPTERKFKPLAGLFGKESAPVMAAPMGTQPATGAPVSYGIPGPQYAPPASASSPFAFLGKKGGLPGGKPSIPAASYPDPFPVNAMRNPAPAPTPTMPMNAVSGRSSVPGGTGIPGATRYPADSLPIAAAGASMPLPPASPSAPYRVQFGAFQRLGHADELAGMLDGAGIPTSVFAAPGTGLNVVVTDAGFRTAEEAQRWIDFEGARRGWTERPVVIR